VAIYVVPTAAGGARTRIASIGRGVRAHRMASRALLHRPWSPDGSRLLYLAPSADGKHELLFHVGPDGKNPARVGPEDGLVENASWLAPDVIVYTHRESRLSTTHTIYLLNVARGGAGVEHYPFKDDSAIVDLAPSPDGKWLAVLHLSGARDERRRMLTMIDAKSPRPIEVEGTGHANVLTWTPDGSRLLYVDTATGEVPAWLPGQQQSAPPVTGGTPLSAILAADGHVIGLTQAGMLVAIDLESGATKELGQGHAPVSAAGGKMALVRRGSSGAAVVIADGTKAAIEAGDIGLEKPAAPPAPPSPPAPPPGQPPPQPPPGVQNGGATPTGGVVPPQPPG
jgi:dipeptidyl aminopeptidase/acylaminoacyl peptidase